MSIKHSSVLKLAMVTTMVLLLNPWQIAPLAASTISPVSGLSGSWFDPAKEGQGFTIQVLSGDSALLTWFTYDTQGNQFWLQGVGNRTGNTLNFEQLLRFEGHRFGQDFKPEDRVVIAGGSLELVFDSCNSAVATYSGSDELPADVLNVQRLTIVAGFDCESQVAPTLSGSIHRGLSGAWFEPAQNGQGWMIELLSEDLALVYWFTFDTQGRQRWLMGVAVIVDNGMISFDMFRPVGGRFGPNFDPGEVDFEYWGEFALTHTRCGRAVASFYEDETGDYGWYHDVHVLATIGGSDPCAFPGGLAELAGEITAAPASAVDGTTNDPNAPLVPNNTPTQGQETGNPISIVGFAAAAPVGFGRFANSSDEWDEYRMPLLAGQTLQLIVADWDPANPAANDLDLWLFKDGETEAIANSLTIQRNEFIQITESGLYEVAVHAFSGASAYTLHASYAPVPAAATTLSSVGRFVDGEIVVGLKRPSEKGTSSTAAVDRLQQLAHEMNLEMVSTPPIGPALMRLSTSGLHGDAGLETDSTDSKDAKRARRKELIAAIKHLSARDDVAFAHPNYLLDQTSNDPRLPEQWHYNPIRVPQAWLLNQGDPNVLVAVLDSGVGPHPDLEANVRRDLGFDAIEISRNFGPVSGRGDDPAVSGSNKTSSHGTHVAGTIAAILGNARDGAGVAPSTSIMPVRVLGNTGSGSIEQIINGIYWAAGRSRVSNLPDPVRRADIINLSLGGFGNCPAAMEEAINFALGRGVIVIAAAGNETSSLNFMPAVCPGVISVAATNRHGQPAYYSNCGSHVAVAAPGGEVVPSSIDNSSSGPGGTTVPRFQPGNASSCRPDPATISAAGDGVLSTDYHFAGAQRSPRFQAMQGTSMAAPHVAGVAALMKSTDSGLTPSQFAALLGAGTLTDRSAGPGWDAQAGRGLINARKAVEAVTGGQQPIPGSLAATPANLSFGETAAQRTLTIEPRGDNTGSLDTFAQSNAPWLVSAQALDVDSAGFGLWEFGVDRTGLFEGLYQGNLSIQTTTGVVGQVPVDLRVGALSETGRAGFLYLLIIDPLTGGIVGLFGGSGFEGHYLYETSGLVPGPYLLIAFSNVSYQFNICGQGEFCGYHPGSGTISPVSLAAGARTEVGTFSVFPDQTGLAEAGSAQTASLEFSRAQRFAGLPERVQRQLETLQIPPLQPVSADPGKMQPLTGAH